MYHACIGIVWSCLYLSRAESFLLLYVFRARRFPVLLSEATWTREMLEV